MLFKQILLLKLVLISLTNFSQKNGANFIGEWKEGVLNNDSTISPRPARRGSGYGLEILKDSSVILYNSDDCGSGFSRKGLWSFDSIHNILTLKFSYRNGYANEPLSTGDINQTEKFMIIKSSSTLLIITSIYKDNPTTYILLRK